MSMLRSLLALMLLGLPAVGLLATCGCEDEAEIETPAGDIEVEEDGDIDVDKK